MDKPFRKLLDRYRVTQGKSFRLRNHDPGDTGDHKLERTNAEALLKASTTILSEQQSKLYAQDRWSLPQAPGQPSPSYIRTSRSLTPTHVSSRGNRRCSMAPMWCLPRCPTAKRSGSQTR